VPLCRLALMLSSLKAKRAEKSANVNSRVMTLHREVTDAEDRLKRLYRLVEDGMTDLDDVLKQRIDRPRLIVIAPKLSSMQQNLSIERQSALTQL
jgi:hypothetical protein